MATFSQSQRLLKILIVEDNRDARTTLRMLLTIGLGHAVFEAGEGLRAIQIAVEKQPDVALIDLGLPDIDGYEVARRIRQSLGHSQIFLAALTGYDDEDDRARTQQAGFDVHLVKPVESAALAKLLSRVAAAERD